MASAILNPRTALNDPWVKYRCQPRPQPQASGRAAMRARNGTATNTATRTRSAVLLGSGLTSGRGPGAGPRGVRRSPRRVAALSVVAVIGVPRSAGFSGQMASGFAPTMVWGQCKYAYVTVAYDTVGCARVLTQSFPERRFLKLRRPPR